MSTATTALLAAGIVGSVGFVATFLVDGATRPGYRPRYHSVSALALGGRGWVQTANFVVCGLLVVASAVGIHRATTSPWLAAAVALFGLGLVASGMWPMDPMRGYPPGTRQTPPAHHSRAHQRHDSAGAVVFGTLPVAAGIAAFTLDSGVWAAYSALTAVAFAVLATVFGWAWEADRPDTGLVQRIAIVVGLAWLAASCGHLLATTT